jgi:hypothetical protein
VSLLPFLPNPEGLTYLAVYFPVPILFKPRGKLKSKGEWGFAVLWAAGDALVPIFILIFPKAVSYINHLWVTVRI